MTITTIISMNMSDFWDFIIRVGHTLQSGLWRLFDRNITQPNSVIFAQIIACDLVHWSSYEWLKVSVISCLQSLPLHRLAWKWKKGEGIILAQGLKDLLPLYCLSHYSGGATSWENLFMPYANNKGTDQPAHLRSLICTFVVHCLDSIISQVSNFAISWP